MGRRPADPPRQVDCARPSVRSAGEGMGYMDREGSGTPVPGGGAKVTCGITAFWQRVGRRHS